MKRAGISGTTEVRSGSRKMTKTRGRLAALFVLVSVVAALGLSTLVSAERQKSPAPTLKTQPGSYGAGEGITTSVFEGTAGPGSFTSASLMGDLKTASGEKWKQSKVNAKGRGSAAPSRTKAVRSRAAKSSANNSKGGKPDGRTKTPPPSLGGDPKVTEHLNALGQTVYSVPASNFDVSPPLTQLATMDTEVAGEIEHEELPFPSWRIPRSNQKDPVTQVAPSAKRSALFPILSAPTTGFNFLGVAGVSSFPPDNNGSVGNDQYVETVNTRYQVWTLNRGTSTVTSLLGPSSINTLWAGFGGACQTQNAGDPVVLFDKVANRWLISQFTSSASGGNYFQCVAISTTANAAGTYFRYAFVVPSSRFGDYPHYGVWSDAYYVMAHGFTSASGGSYVGALFAAMDRTKMLAGDSSATWQVIIDSTEGGHMPADLDGFAPPPTGAPGIFASLHSGGMYIYRMKVDFATPANTVRTLQAVVPVAPSSAACGGAGCLPQPGSGVVLDSLADRLMFRLAYRNFIDHESLVVTHSVDPGITGVVSGVRWYDFRLSGQPDAICPSYPCTYQQGTVADVANGRSRWMPSIGMDGAENILVGYSTTGKTNLTENHTIRYTGRAKGDPLGTMTAPETTIATGIRNSSGTRWGDYSSMSVDPADDCTFWYVNQFYTTTGSATWKTQIASSRFPAGAGAGQCLAATCTARPTSAPVIGVAAPIADNQIQVTWTAVSPEPGSYAIERAIGPVGSEGLYQPLAAVPGNATNYIDTTVQGGVTYTYRVIAATDAAGRCQALVRSDGTSTTATGNCNLKPVFAGATSASSGGGSFCSVTINWSPATSSCPLSPTMRYNIFRGTVPDFVPSVGNRIASCVTGPSSYVDMNNLSSGTTYYYVVRAEDNTSVNGGECSGGNEESNSVVVAGTAYGPGVQAAPGTWTDGGGDGTAFLQLNSTGAGNTTDQTWRFVKTANDAGANHTPGGSYAYRTAGPAPSNTYSSNECAVAETPTLTVGSATLNLTYWERHQLEKGWDGVAIEYSRNGGAWTDVPAPTNSTGNGCLVSDITTDYATLGCTGAPPSNACAYPASKSVITGPIGSGTSCANWVTSATVSAYGRRCHLLTGLTPGDTIKFRWRMVSDPSAEFAGFYLDDIGVTNILLPESCTTSSGVGTTLTVAPATGTFGGTTNLSATLTDGASGINGKSIAFTLNGNPAGSATTNANGVATLFNASLTGISVGNYPNGVGASFAGDATYAGSSGTNSLTVVDQCTNNVALASNGASASASSQYGALFPASGVIDGEHHGNNWGSGGAWNDGTLGSFPDNVEVNFNASQSINEIDVYTLKDDYNSGSTVSEATTFSSYGITNFEVQYWNGSGWVVVPGGTVTGNNLVKRKFVFTAIATNRIRVVVNGSADGYSRVVELEAFSCAAATPT
ncbi:MAG TPA: hypothetical protein VGN90_03600, partial [Pyrinomonadaceae bacterium]|nr:hypothetical protein [Pyrinomonadaceae bacterium]